MLQIQKRFKHAHRLASVALGCLIAWPAVAAAEPCPEDARYATNQAGQAFCLFENMALPAANDVAPYCHYLEYGYIGFSWTETAATASYVCPDGSYKTDNGAGHGFCLLDNLWLPPAADLTPYCTYLADGYFGFSWTD